MGLLELLYYAGYRFDRWRKLRAQRRLPVRVVSIGNITLGGTGKTPATIALAAEALRRGLKPCILTRGYGGSLRGPVAVTPEMSAADVGDEPLLMAHALWPEVCVIKCADRYKGGLYALEHMERKPDLFILDDGFQHYALARDMDIVLVNALDPFSGGRLLPLGRLREPLSELKRASAFVITKADSPARAAQIRAELTKHNPAAPVFVSLHAQACVRAYGAEADGGSEAMEGNWLRGRPVYLFSGIADPGSFHALVREAGADLKGTAVFGDHHRYSQSELARVAEEARRAGAHWILTTEKDIMRLGGMRIAKDSGINIAALAVRFEVQEGFYDLALAAKLEK